MSELRIRITKRADGGSVLRCDRADGTVTWQRCEGPNAAFFPLHDLTHYAVECELCIRRGFYGLIAEGWDIADTTGQGRRGPLPDETLAVEHLVGLLDTERASSTRLSTAEVNRHASSFAAAGGRTAPRPITAAELGRVRDRVQDLLQQWARLAQGGTIDLTF